jgi:cell division septation protein DedD
VGFAVQIAASRTRQKAEELRTIWQDRGYTAYVVETDIPGSGRYYRVRVGPFGTQEEAREVASNMQSRFPQELPDFWIVPYQQ